MMLPRAVPLRIAAAAAAAAAFEFGHCSPM